jgi:hypothetical protein
MTTTDELYEAFIARALERNWTSVKTAEHLVGLSPTDEQIAKVQADMVRARAKDVTTLTESERLAEIAEIIEEGDRRLMHIDGPIGGMPPEITLDEWRRIYVLATGKDD